MPRIYSSQSDPFDFCNDCCPNEEEAIERYGYLGDGPDDRGDCYGYDAEHPDYEYEDYRCVDCGKPLTKDDN